MHDYVSLTALSAIGRITFLGYIESTLSLMIIDSFSYFIANGYFFYKYHGSLGQKVLGVKVLNRRCSSPKFRVYILRYFAMIAPLYILHVGMFYPFANVLTIFGKQRKCLHDYIAKTIVVRVKPKS